MAVTCENLKLARGAFQLSVSLDIPQGASLALIGPSGGGKSLFLGGLAGFDKVTSGRVILNGADTTDIAPQDRPVTLMFQDHNLFAHLTAAQNVGLGRNPGLRLSADDWAAIAQAFRSVELEGMENRYPAELSGGQQSRVALARALVRNRPILLLDEPFSALGPALRADMLARVDAARKADGTTLIFVTHDPQDAQSADLAAFVGQGTITTPRPTSEFFQGPPEGLAEYLFGQK